MNEANYASLTAGLLARKGQARPAMRPQFYRAEDDDLGWNDMGVNDMLTAEQKRVLMPASSAAVPEPSQVTVSKPEPKASAPETAAGTSVAPVVRNDAVLKPLPSVRPAPAPIARPRAGATGKSRAAFTLRLDSDRHLKLRLACAVARKSAQQIVTEALDEYLTAKFPNAAKAAPKTAAG